MNFMPRRSRIVLPGCCHHITQRGVRSLPLFFDDLDRIAYQYFLRDEARSADLKFMSYSLMPNHLHLVVIPRTASSLARAIGNAHKRYTWMINHRMEKRGFLFQGRFYSEPLEEEHFWSTMRYVERNSTHAGLSETPWNYRWSSCRFNTGIITHDPLIKEISFNPEWWKNFLGGPL